MQERLSTSLGSTEGLDPLIVQAAEEVDQSLILWSLSLSPLERLRACTRAARALARFQRVTPQDNRPRSTAPRSA